MATNHVLLRVTDENENPIPDCRIFWKTPELPDWHDPQVTYRVGPQGVHGDGSVLAKVRDTVPQAAESDRRLGDASMNYSIIFNSKGQTPFSIKITAEGYRPAVVAAGQTDPYAQRYSYQVVHLRRNREESSAPQNASPPQQAAPPTQESYSATVIFVRRDNSRAPNVDFKFVMSSSGYTTSGRSDSEGQATVTVPEYGPCKIIFYQPNGVQKVVTEVVAMNVNKYMTILW